MPAGSRNPGYAIAYRIDQRAAQTESPPEPLRMPAPLNQLPWDVIGIGAAVTRRPLPHHRAYGSVHGGSRRLREQSSHNDGSPSDLKYAFESPTARALAFARYQGPRPLPAVLLASGSRTRSSNRAARRRRGVFHCRHVAALSRNRTQRVKPISTSGVSQNPK